MHVCISWKRCSIHRMTQFLAEAWRCAKTLWLFKGHIVKLGQQRLLWSALVICDIVTLVFYSRKYTDSICSRPKPFNHDNTSCLFHLFSFLSTPHLMFITSALCSFHSLPAISCAFSCFPILTNLLATFLSSSFLIHFPNLSSKLTICFSKANPGWKICYSDFPRPSTLPISLSLWLSLSWNRHQRFPHITQPSRTLLFAWGSLRAPHSQLLF